MKRIEIKYSEKNPHGAIRDRCMISRSDTAVTRVTFRPHRIKAKDNLTILCGPQHSIHLNGMELRRGFDISVTDEPEK